VRSERSQGDRGSLALASDVDEGECKKGTDGVVEVIALEIALGRS
jgi:hypothetical protein